MSIPFRPRHKFKAVIVEHDGFKFSSKAEGAYYLRLKERVAAGEVIGFTRQVPFYFPGGVKYVCDFLEFHADGSTHFVEVKGMETEQYKAKRRLLAALYPWVTVEQVTSTGRPAKPRKGRTA